MQALKPLGYRLLADMPNHSIAGFGIEDNEGKRDLWIKSGAQNKSHSFSCLAFTASSKEMVDKFYKAAIEAGGKDNGAP